MILLPCVITYHFYQPISFMCVLNFTMTAVLDLCLCVLQIAVPFQCILCKLTNACEMFNILGQLSVIIYCYCSIKCCLSSTHKITLPYPRTAGSSPLSYIIRQKTLWSCDVIPIFVLWALSCLLYHFDLSKNVILCNWNKLFIPSNYVTLHGVIFPVWCPIHSIIEHQII